MESKLEKLREIIRSYESVLVAFSGGADSTFVLKVAREVLGREKVKAVTAQSASLPQKEFEASCELARLIDVDQLVIETREMEKSGYTDNAVSRCYFCKETLYEMIRPLADQAGFREICNGTNVDDLDDYRPGLKAAEQFAIKSPLVEAGLAKSDVRHFSRELGLSTWDKPAQACLASRIPYGEKVTDEKLDQVERAEDFLRELGFRVVRVRHHGSVARIEVGREEMERFLDEEIRAEIDRALRSLGFLYITLDLQGYRVGSLNEASLTRTSTPLRES